MGIQGTTKRRAGFAGVALAAGALLLVSTPAAAQQCEAGKNLTAGKYALCTAKAEKGLVLKGNLDKHQASQDKCSDKLGSGYAKLEEKGGCATTGDAAMVEDFLAGCAQSVADSLSTGDPLPDLAACATCAVDLADCLDAQGGGLPVTGQTNCYDAVGDVISCTGTGQDAELQSGRTRSFTDNGDGTITDQVTGLVWEKLDDNNANGIHDHTRSLNWENAFRKVRVLNGDASACIAFGNPDTCCTGAGTGSCSPFAGHTDWRLPNIVEIYSLASFGTFGPATSTEFNSACTAGCTTATCSCTGGPGSADYWSSTAAVDTTSRSISVRFFNAGVGNELRSTANRVRAVRSLD